MRTCAEQMRTSEATFNDNPLAVAMIAHHGVEIGGSEREVALASKTPVNATGTGNAVHLPAKFAFQGGYPGHELEAEAVVDHREAAGGKRQPSAINP